MVAILRPCGSRPPLMRDLSGDAGGGYWGRFHMVLDCTGPGVERVSIQDDSRDGHASYRFWENDQLEIAGLGLQPDRGVPRVLISGGGDGALQDFLRIAFPGKTPRDLYAQIPKKLQPEIERRIAAAEDVFRRAWVWSQDPGLDCEVLRRLHDEHRETAKWTAKRGKFLPISNTELMSRVTVVHRCDHFSLCYPFNRFLALLVNEYAGGNRFVPRRTVHAVKAAHPDQHRCEGRAAQCWEHPHHVLFDASSCVGSSHNADPEEFDLVILRHGPHADTPRLARQMLPYDLPWPRP
jgi:hypothetical protein